MTCSSGKDVTVPRSVVLSREETVMVKLSTELLIVTSLYSAIASDTVIYYGGLRRWN